MIFVHGHLTALFLGFFVVGQKTMAGSMWWQSGSSHGWQKAQGETGEGTRGRINPTGHPAPFCVPLNVSGSVVCSTMSSSMTYSANEVSGLVSSHLAVAPSAEDQAFNTLSLGGYFIAKPWQKCSGLKKNINCLRDSLDVLSIQQGHRSHLSEEQSAHLW